MCSEKTPKKDELIGEYCHPVKEEMIQRIKKKRNHINSFYETITLVLLSEKNITRKENYKPLPLMNIDANKQLK